VAMGSSPIVGSVRYSIYIQTGHNGQKKGNSHGDHAGLHRVQGA